MKKGLNNLVWSFCMMGSCVGAIVMLICTFDKCAESKPKTYYHREIVVDVNDGACDYSIFYSPEDAKIARKGIMTSAYGDKMRFEYEGQEYTIKVKDVDKFIEFDKKKGE